MTTGSEQLPTRVLGRTGFPVTEVGFGAWAIGAEWGQAVPEDQARAALHAALNAGMNFIDTADIYGAGRSESIIGQVLAERRSGPRVYVATKMGRGPGWAPTLDAVCRAAEASCQRLGVVSLDLVQLHCIEFALIQDGGVIAALEGAVARGLVQHWGASVETADEALWCLEHTQAASLQVIFNIFRQRLTERLLPAAQAARVGLIARVPLASGVLSGKFLAGHAFGAGDHRHFNANGECFNVGETFAGVPLETGIALADKIKALLAAEIPNASLTQKALRWILDHPAITTVIPGAKSPLQAQENAAAARFPSLSAQAHNTLQNLYQTEISSQVRGRY